MSDPSDSTPPKLPPKVPPEAPPEAPPPVVEDDGEELLDEADLPEGPAAAEKPLFGWDEADEEDLLGPGLGDSDGPMDDEELPDERLQTASWLTDDGFTTEDDEEELLPDVAQAVPAAPVRVRVPAQRVLVGVEELAVLIDLGGVVIPATMATGVAESVLAAPLRSLEDGRVQVRLGSRVVEADPRGLATRVRVGRSVMPVTLRLVEGPALRLVLGRDGLAGHVVVDPSVHFLLSSPPDGGEE